MAREGVMVRSLATAAVALVVGLALGGVPARREARSLRDELGALKEQGCEDGGAIGRQLAQAFRDRPWEADRPGGASTGGARRAGPPPMKAAQAEPLVEFGDAGDAGDAGGEADGAEEGVPEGLDMAREALAIRQRQAFAALEEQAQPSEEQLDAIEGAVADMNADLLELAQAFVQTAQEGDPQRRDVMMFAADTLDVLIEADERLSGALTPEQREALDDEALDPMSYADPALIDAFSALDGSPR